MMHTVPPSPFDTLETCFGLLTKGPAPMAVNGHRLGHGLPTRPIPLIELRALLQHPTATPGLQRTVVQELVHLATQHRGRWTIGLAGVLLPGLRQIAAWTPSIGQHAASHVEADLLEQLRNAICQPAPVAVGFAVGVIGVASSARQPPAKPSRCGCLGA